MRIHKTKYATLSDQEILAVADRQGFNVSEIGLELMERLQEHIDITAAALETIEDLGRQLDEYVDRHPS